MTVCERRGKDRSALGNERGMTRKRELTDTFRSIRTIDSVLNSVAEML